ncbi:hypothetical protein T484DRAFT_1772468 [Baffinella frigidus]|nr:hypothetical protein T484DRAFT_1772468 [Cryptophyta sp. CCMP2293]
MKRANRKLFLHRLQKLRLDAFLTPAARELAAAIRQGCLAQDKPTPPRIAQ